MFAEQTIVVVPNAWAAIIVGLFLPLVVGLVTKYSASAGVKVVVGILVAGVAAVLQQAIANGGDAILTTETARVFVLTYGVQVLTYLGIYGPVDANAKLLPAKGVGAGAPAA